MNTGIIPLQWLSAKEIYIPKVKHSTEHNISDFRQIALLNVEGKHLFSLVSICLETHLINNKKFINVSTKGLYAKGSWILGTYLNGLGSSERSQIQKLIFSNNMA